MLLFLTNITDELHVFALWLQTWFVLVWSRSAGGVTKEWVGLDFDPALGEHEYVLAAAHDDGGLWRLTLEVDGAARAELAGLSLPALVSAQLRAWGHAGYVQPLPDPFAPFATRAVLAQLSVPLPKVTSQ